MRVFMLAHLSKWVHASCSIGTAQCTSTAHPHVEEGASLGAREHEAFAEIERYRRLGQEWY